MTISRMLSHSSGKDTAFPAIDMLGFPPTFPQRSVRLFSNAGYPIVMVDISTCSTVGLGSGEPEYAFMHTLMHPIIAPLDLTPSVEIT